VRPAAPIDVATEISSLIDEVLSESDDTDLAAAPADDGTFPADDADTWVGAPPQTTTIGHAPTRPPSAQPTPVPDVAQLMKPLGKKPLPPRADFDAEGTGKQAPLRDVLATPAPERLRTIPRSPSPSPIPRSPSPSPQPQFAVGSRTELEPAKTAQLSPRYAMPSDEPRDTFTAPETPTARRVTPAHMPPPPPRTPPHGAAMVGGMSADSQAQTLRQPARGAVDPLAQTMSPSSKLDAAGPHLHIDARTTRSSDSRSSESQAQTARQPRRVLTPPSGLATSTASARSEIERMASRPQMPVVRITPPHGASNAGAAHDAMQSPPHRMWMGRPTPSEQALPPAPHLTPSGQLPSLPARMATGTSPIVNKPASISIVRVAVWAVALFGVGFAAALGIAAL
jgi:hypothetical protein